MNHFTILISRAVGPYERCNLPQQTTVQIEYWAVREWRNGMHYHWTWCHDIEQSQQISRPNLKCTEEEFHDKTNLGGSTLELVVTITACGYVVGHAATDVCQCSRKSFMTLHHGIWHCKLCIIYICVCVCVCVCVVHGHQRPPMTVWMILISHVHWLCVCTARAIKIK